MASIFLFRSLELNSQYSPRLFPSDHAWPQVFYRLVILHTYDLTACQTRCVRNRLVGSLWTSSNTCCHFIKLLQGLLSSTWQQLVTCRRYQTCWDRYQTCWDRYQTCWDRLVDLVPTDSLKKGLHFNNPVTLWCLVLQCGTTVIKVLRINYKSCKTGLKQLGWVGLKQLKQLGWQTLEDRWKIDKAVLMFKIGNDMVPPYLSERFVKRETGHGYNTRGSHINLSLPKPNTNFLKSV